MRKCRCSRICLGLAAFDAWRAVREAAAGAADVACEVATVWRDPAGWAHRPVTFWARLPGGRRPRSHRCTAVFVDTPARMAAHFWRRSRDFAAAELAALVGRHHTTTESVRFAGVAARADGEGGTVMFVLVFDFAANAYTVEWGKHTSAPEPIPEIVTLGKFLAGPLAGPPAGPRAGPAGRPESAAATRASMARLGRMGEDEQLVHLMYRREGR